jgi:PRTRC genetic system protein A
MKKISVCILIPIVDPKEGCKMKAPLYHSLRDSLESKKPLSYVPGSDGRLYEVRESLIGRMVAPATAAPSFGSIEPGFQMNLPKIPEVLFREMYSFFKDYTRKASLEVMVCFFYDLQEENYILVCPNQRVSKYGIQAEYDSKYLGRNSVRYVPVAQVHSHNVMRAYFSQTDDADEKAFGIYGVIGRLNREVPECVFRVKANDTSLVIPVSLVFEGTPLKHIPYPDQWHDNVRQEVGL